MKVGTKSILFGAHAIWFHPFAVWRAWIKLYGWTWSIPTIVSFFVHDIGYWGKPNMDGPEGKTHPELGARIMRKLFDANYPQFDYVTTKWHDFTLLHSRHYSKLWNVPHSKLCVADKLAFCVTPYWLYKLHMKLNQEELNEYLTNSYRKHLYFEIKQYAEMPFNRFERSEYGKYRTEYFKSLMIGSLCGCAGGRDIFKIHTPNTPFTKHIHFSKVAYNNHDKDVALKYWHKAIYKDTIDWVVANSDYKLTKKEKERVLP